MRTLIRLSTLLLVSTSACHASGRIPAACDVAQLHSIVDRAIHPIMTEFDVPGLAVAVSRNGHASFFNYGVASRESGLPVSENTLFEIGSDSKLITATLAAYAEALGKLSFADHPAKYLPQLERAAINNATLLNLGTFTAGGLPLQFPDSVTDDHMIDYFRYWKPETAPGAQRRYSNPSIGLLGDVTAIAMNRDFADAVETQLFPRLGLHHSYIRVPQSAMGSYAWGYNSANKPVRVNPGVLDAEAYGVKSTAADMIRFVQANIDPSTLEPPLRHAVEETQIGFYRIEGMVQGLGWEQYAYPVSLERLLAGNSSTMSLESNVATALVPPQPLSAPTLFDKTGSTNGFGAYIAFVPSKKIGVVILANKNYPIAARVSAAYGILNGIAGLSQ